VPLAFKKKQKLTLLFLLGKKVDSNLFCFSAGSFYIIFIRNGLWLSHLFTVAFYVCRSKLLKWMDRYLQLSNIAKSSEDSIKYRTQGNEKFKARQDEHSLHLYSKSILVAPLNSEEYAVSLGNRSAVLFEMKLFEVSVILTKEYINTKVYFYLFSLF